MSYNPPKGPGKGPGNGNARAAPLTGATASDAGRASGYVRRMRAEARQKAIADGRAVNQEPLPSRAEIAELGKSAMPAALERLERLIHESRSDMAIVQAFNALKEVAYGKDTQGVAVDVTVTDMTEDEIRALIAEEFGLTIEHQPGPDTSGAG